MVKNKIETAGEEVVAQIDTDTERCWIDPKATVVILTPTGNNL